MISKYPDDTMCYLSAVETDSAAADSVKDSMRADQSQFALKKVETTVDVSVYSTLHGVIKDTSFLPESAVVRCTQGFQWRALSTTSKYI